jgi:hypothetical protein
MKFSVKRIGNQAHKKQRKGVMENAPNCDSQKKLIVIKYKELEYSYSFYFLSESRGNYRDKSCDSSQRGYLTSTPEPPEAGFDGVHGVVSSLCEHHINRLSPTAMDWISFGASRKFLRALAGPISVTMNTGSNPVFRKRTCVLSTTADAAEPAKITNIQQTRNV